MRRVVVTEPVHPDAVALLRDAGWQVVGPPADPQPCDALLVRTRPLTAAEVGMARMIAKHGVGVDNIPLDAARAAGVAVLNTPGANAGAVTEQTILLILALARGLDAQRAAAGAGARSPAVRGVEGLRLTVVGLGDIGRRVAALGAGLGMAVTVVSRSLAGDRTAEGYRVATLAAALPQTDVLTLHCPLTPQTRHMIDAAALAALPRGAMVVNTARGGIVDEGALAAALHAGLLGGAALDVTEVEPLPADSPLRGAPGLILTPHSATLSDGAFRRMGIEAARNILDHAAGQPRKGCIVVP